HGPRGSGPMAPQPRIFAWTDVEILAPLDVELDGEPAVLPVGLGDELRPRLLAGLERKQGLEVAARRELGALAAIGSLQLENALELGGLQERRAVITHHGAHGPLVVGKHLALLQLAAFD